MLSASNGCDLWGTMMISRGDFFFVSKILAFWAKKWVKVTNGPK